MKLFVMFPKPVRKNLAVVAPLLVTVLAALPLPTHAQAARSAKPKVTLTVQQIMEKYVAATGGRAAYDKITSLVTKTEIVVTAQNIKATGEIYAKAPNKFYAVQNFPSIGKVEEGYDGNVAWSKDPLNGLRILSGVEKDQLKREASFNSPLQWRTLYKSASVLGIRKVDGNSAYAVRFVPALGKPTVQYFDTKSFLLVREDAVSESAQGTNPVESYPSDYRVVNGIKIPFKTRLLQGPAELQLTITDVKMNVPVDDTLFAKPAATTATR